MIAVVVIQVSSVKITSISEQWMVAAVVIKVNRVKITSNSEQWMVAAVVIKVNRLKITSNSEQYDSRCSRYQCEQGENHVELRAV